MKKLIISFFFSAFCFGQEVDSLKTVQIEMIQLIVKKSIETTDKGVILNVAGTDLEKKDNVLDILKYAPSISDGYKVLGSSKVQIILNGKEIKIKPEQFSTFLSSIQGGVIKNIEVVDKADSSVDSKFDSQIIITTKKIEGWNSSLGMGVSSAKYFGNSADASLMLSSKKIDLYLSGDWFERITEIKGNSIRKVDLETRTGNSLGDLKRQGISSTANIDYNINDRNTIGFLYNYTRDGDLDRKTNYQYDILSPLINQKLYVEDDSNNTDDSHSFSLLYRHDFNESDDIQFSVDYATDDFSSLYNSHRATYNSGGILQNEGYLRNDSYLKYKLFSTQADYKNILKSGNNIKLGIKYINSSNLNILDVFENFQYVDAQSQHFNFYEEIFASYLNYSFKKKRKFSFSFGLRYELSKNKFNTNKGFKGEKDNDNFLPYFRINYDFNPNHRIYFFSSKGISRPDFFSYDPSIVSTQPNEYSSGNEGLSPVKQYRIQIGYTLKKKYNFILQYIYSEDNIVYIPHTIGQDIFTKPENAGYANQLRFVISVPIKITNFWKTNNSINLIHRNLNISQFSENDTKTNYFTIQNIHDIKILNKLNLELSFIYMNSQKVLYTYYYSNFNANIGVYIPLFEKRAKLSFRISDVFNTQRSKSDYDFNEIYRYNYSKSNTRTVSLKFTYNIQSGREVDDDIRESNIQETLDRAKQ